MIKHWPRKLMFTGIGASLIIWTSGARLTEHLMEKAYADWSGTSYKFFEWLYECNEARYPLIIAIAVTVFAAYLTFAPKNSN